MTEEWRDIPGYPFYQVSSNGRIRSLDHTTQAMRRDTPFVHFYKGQVLKPDVNAGGYLYVILMVDKKRTFALVHRLILLTFVGLPPEGHQCCHNNGVRADNRLENLRWGTPRANALDRITHGTHTAGNRCYKAKLSWEDVDWIRNAYAEKRYDQVELSKMFGIVQTGISKMIRFETWKPEYRREAVCPIS